MLIGKVTVRWFTNGFDLNIFCFFINKPAYEIFFIRVEVPLALWSYNGRYFKFEVFFNGLI